MTKKRKLYQKLYEKCLPCKGRGWFDIKGRCFDCGGSGWNEVYIEVKS